jgi:hypothetical protein
VRRLGHDERFEQALRLLDRITCSAIRPRCGRSTRAEALPSSALTQIPEKKRSSDAPASGKLALDRCFEPWSA